MKLWAGRFQKETDTLVNDFNSSIQFDARLYKQDIAGSIAHAQMLGKQGIVEEHEVEQIVEGLKAILADIEADKVEFSVDNEDIHMNIETLLTQRIGDAGKRLHTGRSRNDQVALDMRMYVKKELKEICLLDQTYVKAEDGKQSVAKYVEEVAKANGANVTIKGFVRFETGEGLEKKNEDFAAEVAAQMGN